jgi:hypothetical protein
MSKNPDFDRIKRQAMEAYKEELERQMKKMDGKLPPQSWKMPDFKGFKGFEQPNPSYTPWDEIKKMLGLPEVASASEVEIQIRKWATRINKLEAKLEELRRAGLI